jgi:hypothetical protein
MPRGGPRPNSGRPRLPPNQTIMGTRPQLNEDDKAALSGLPKSTDRARIIDGELVLPPNWQLPLEYLVTAMNDPTASDARRDRIALGLAPYLHARKAEVGVGARQKAEDAARNAGQGTAWSQILRTAA